LFREINAYVVDYEEERKRYEETRKKEDPEMQEMEDVLTKFIGMCEGNKKAMSDQFENDLSVTMDISNFSVLQCLLCQTKLKKVAESKKV